MAVNIYGMAEQITDALEVEQLDVSLFRSSNLRLPAHARGAFGGQVISQALVSATQCVDPAYSLHSLHCYFLLSVSETVPILYHVDRVRNGRSYVTRGVRAVQRGRTVFMMLCSFQLPEPRQPVFQWPMPANVPPPEECASVETMYEKQLAEATSEKNKAFLRTMLAERARSPIEVRLAGMRNEGLPMYMYWHKVKDRDTPMKYDPAFQKCILSYISDAMFLGGGRRALAFVNEGGKGPTKSVMQTSLDHNISFYDDKLDCSDWLLYVIVSEVAYSGRTNVHGRMYSPSGSLIAVCNQEGVLRVDPDELTKVKPSAKL